MTPAEVEDQVRDEIADELMRLSRTLLPALEEGPGSVSYERAHAAWHAYVTAACVARGPVVIRDAVIVEEAVTTRVVDTGEEIITTRVVVT